MIKTKLSTTDFTKYFRERRIGALYFPNGNAGVWSKDFFIELRNLYKLVVGWKINHTAIQPSDIIAIIAFGSASRYPGFTTIKYMRRKYFLFGPKILKTKKVDIQPNDADFLVITKNDMTLEESFTPVCDSNLYEGPEAMEGGIHIVVRGVNQVINGIKAEDTVSQSALLEGVLVFSNNNFDEIFSSVPLFSETPRKIYWDEDEEGIIYGKIE